MTDTCVKHSFEVATDVCRQCKHSYCAECLIYSFGEKKPPYCVTCALNAAGVRHKGAKQNPKAKKRGLFGRKGVVEEEPKKELGFFDVKIELPAEAENSPVMTDSFRRTPPPELVAELEMADVPAEVPSEITFERAPSPVLVDDQPANDLLADWASSLPDTPGVATSDAPSKGIAAWPEQEGGSGSQF